LLENCSADPCGSPSPVGLLILKLIQSFTEPVVILAPVVILVPVVILAKPESLYLPLRTTPNSSSTTPPS